jgi:hypothetical protein
MLYWPPRSHICKRCLRSVRPRIRTCRKPAPRRPLSPPNNVDRGIELEPVSARTPPLHCPGAARTPTRHVQRLSVGCERDTRFARGQPWSHGSARFAGMSGARILAADVPVRGIVVRPLRWNERCPHLAVMIRMLGGKAVKENHFAFVNIAYILPILLILRIFHEDRRPATTILR